MKPIRTFIALPLPSVLREAIAGVQTELRTSSAEVKWEERDKFHITLKFLGDTDPAAVPLLEERLADALRGLKSFDLTFEGVGGFPNVHHPKVVWVGTQPNDSIKRLQECVEESCAPLGFARENRPFHAHVTLGRVKGNRGLDRLTASLKSVTFEPSITRCTEIHLMKSDLKPAGSVYTLLKSIPLVP